MRAQPRCASPAGRSRFRVLPLLAVAGALSVSIAGTAIGEPEAAPAPTPQLLQRGAALYTQHCAACHGETGRGDGKAAYLVYPKPRDFTLTRFRLVSADNKVASVSDLFATITRGMPGSAMPGWGHFSEADRWALAYQVRALTRDGKAARLVAEDGVDPAVAAKVAERLTTPGAPVAVPPEPPVTPEALERGKRIYTESCVSCHDVDGRGLKKRDLKDDNEFPIFARDFTRGVFKGGTTGADLAHRLLAGMPGTPMPSYRENIPKGDDLWALIHYVQSMIVPGAQERVLQRQISLRAVRVSEEQVLFDPTSPVWQKMPATFVPLMPLWWRDDRVEGVEVRAARNALQVAFQLTWTDTTRNELTIAQDAFSDGAALQFSPSADPPFFGMGARSEPVNIWSWKAAWENDLASFRDVQEGHPDMVVDRYQSLQDPPLGRHSPVGEFPTGMHDPTWLTGWGAGNVVSHPKRVSSVEDLNAQGFSTLTNQGKGAQSVFGRARWDSGTWRVVFVRELAASEAPDVIFRPGGSMNIGFAVWNGAASDRNGQKSVTIWHRLAIDE